MDRKAELEQKKAKLQALREEHDRGRKTKEQKDMEEAAGKLGHSDTGTRKDVNEMLSSLGVTPVCEVLSSFSSLHMATSDQSSATPISHESLQPGINYRKKPANLCVMSLQPTKIPSNETVVYSKQTRTNNPGGFERDAPATDNCVVASGEGHGDEEQSCLGHNDRGFHGLPTGKEVAPVITPLQPMQEDHKMVKELSDEQKQMIVESENFQRFILKVGKVMERALSETVDCHTDYIGGSEMDDKNGARSLTRLSLNRTFYSNRWSRKLCVTAFDWSAYYPELVVASLSCFAKIHPNLSLGGTYSNRMVLWDKRVQKRTLPARPVEPEPKHGSSRTKPRLGGM